VDAFAWPAETLGCGKLDGAGGKLVGAGGEIVDAGEGLAGGGASSGKYPVAHAAANTAPSKESAARLKILEPFALAIVISPLAFRN